MLNLHILDNIFTNGYLIYGINITGLIVVITGILVIITKNPIVSVLFLIGLFMGISGNLTLLGVNFIAISYLLVYVGAVSILFLFILMLINIRISEIISPTSNSIPLGIMLGILFFSTVYQSLPQNNPLQIGLLKANTKNYNYFMNENLGPMASEGLWNKPLNFSDLNFQTNIKYNNDSFKQVITQDVTLVYSNLWEKTITYQSHIVSLGNVLYTSYPLLLLLTGLVLLLSMVGSIVITIKSKSD